MNFYFATSDQVGREGVLNLPRDDRFERLGEAVSLTVGAQFRICMEDVGRGTAMVMSLDDDCATASFEVTSPIDAAPSIDVVLALPRPKVLRRLVPRLVSMGINSLTLVNACGVLKEYFDTHWLRGEILNSLMILGLEQGGVCRCPSVRIKKRLKPFVEDRLGSSSTGEIRLLCTPDAEGAMKIPAGTSRIVLSIGPETGWTDFEEALFKKAGFDAYSLGAEHLACDVAAIAMIGAVKSRLSASGKGSFDV